MERAAFDLHDLTLHGGFKDGTHVQLTVANCFRLEGGVEHMLEQRVPGHPTGNWTGGGGRKPNIGKDFSSKVVEEPCTSPP